MVLYCTQDNDFSMNNNVYMCDYISRKLQDQLYI